MKSIKLIFGILLMVMFLSSCGVGKQSNDGHEEHEEGGHDDHGEKGTVSLTEQQMDAIGLRMVQLEKRNMTLGVQVTGALELAPQYRADISALMGGIVKSIKVIEGDKVRKGQTLATLEHPHFIQLQQDYIISLNNSEYLKKEYERQEKLYKEKVGSGKTFQKASADFNNNKSRVSALAIKLRMLGLNVTEISKGKIYSSVRIASPIQGIVSLVEANLGAYVAPLTKLFEVVNNAQLHADFRVYEKDISKISVGQKIFFTTTSLLGEEFEGEIHAISPVFESNPKALHIHADITNDKKNLIAGMYIQGRIIAENIVTTVLPEYSVVTEEGKSYVFVMIKGGPHDHGTVIVDQGHKEEHNHSIDKKEEGGHEHVGHDEGNRLFKKMEVIAGMKNDGFVEVKLLESLPKETQIVGKGAYFLLAEIGKGETEHHH